MKERVRISAIFFVAFLMVSTAMGKIIYVDANAPGANDGSSWIDAYHDLQDALAVSEKGDEIHVAHGIYTPAPPGPAPPPTEPEPPQPPPASLVFSMQPEVEYADRTATFKLKTGVILKGGYAGFSGQDPDFRDISVYETILSGDLNGDDTEINDPCDLLNDPCRAENSFHVVTCNGAGKTTVIEGFTISGGNADDQYTGYSDFGGGMYNIYARLMIINCTFSRNSARWGGGMSNRLDSPVVVNCIFTENASSYLAGGISNHYCNTTVTNCTFSRNFAGAGAGIHNWYSNPTVTKCIFRDNSAECGGGIRNGRSSPRVTHCIFSGNRAEDQGGGMTNFASSPTVTNCIFSGNLAQFGGAMYNEGGYNGVCNPELSNCTFAGNTAPNGNALTCYSSYQKYSFNLQLTNCILWDGGSEIWNNDDSTITITYSDVCNGFPGAGNIDADPLFFEPGYCDANGFWIEGDYHLLPGSPCIDAGDPNYVAVPNETDLDGQPRIIGGRINMGAYEYIPPIPAEARIVPHVLSLESKGKWVAALLWLPEDYNVADIDPNSVFLEGQVQPERFWVAEDQQVAIAKFSREDVQAVLDVGEVELAVTGYLTDGSLFKGTDIVQVTHKGWKKPVKYVQASDPEPADGATYVDINADLSWTPGSDAISHDVYFGTGSSPPFVFNQTSTVFDPGMMDYGTRYYWRIDEVYKQDMAEGDVWSFTTIGVPPLPPGGPP